MTVSEIYSQHLEACCGAAVGTAGPNTQHWRKEVGFLYHIFLDPWGLGKSAHILTRRGLAKESGLEAASHSGEAAAGCPQVLP